LRDNRKQILVSAVLLSFLNQRPRDSGDYKTKGPFRYSFNYVYLTFVINFLTNGDSGIQMVVIAINQPFYSVVDRKQHKISIQSSHSVKADYSRHHEWQVPLPSLYLAP